MATAALLVVGDELLGGHTLDTNSQYLAQQLAARGVELRRLVTVPDEPPEIVEQLRRLLADNIDFIFVCGGIGPTPDDRTYEAVARAVGRPLTLTPADRSWMEARIVRSGYGQGLLDDPLRSEALLRMVRRPKGSQALDNPIGAALGSAIQDKASCVFVLPGVPRELRSMFEASLAPHYLPAPSGGPTVGELEVVGEEARFYAVLRELEARYPRLKIGSYPQDEKGKIILRARGEKSDVDAALRRLKEEAGPGARRRNRE